MCLFLSSIDAVAVQNNKTLAASRWVRPSLLLRKKINVVCGVCCWIDIVLFPLSSVHVVFGHVISGQEVVQTMESQKADPNSRPYAEVKVMNCGELVPKSKG